MIVWLIKFEDDIPIDRESYPYRTMMLGDALLKENHQVVRWASNHRQKTGQNRFNGRTSIQYKDNYDIEIIPTIGKPTSSHSVFRFLNIYFQSFYLFIAMFYKYPRPDIIVVSMPAPITALLSTIYAKSRKVYSFIDCRDMWPDILLNEAKGKSKIPALILFLIMKIELIIATRLATGLIGITTPFRDWITKHSGRKVNLNDGVFPLGAKKNVPPETNRNQLIKLLNQETDHKFKEDVNYILFAGTLSQTIFNASGDLYEAMELLSKNKTPVELIICGSGSYEEKIKSKFSGLDNVVFLGHVLPSKLLNIRSICDIGIMCIENRKDYLASLPNKFFYLIEGGLIILTNLDGEVRKEIEHAKFGFHYKNGRNLFEIICKICADKNIISRNRIKSKILYETKYDADLLYTKYVKHLELRYEMNAKKFDKEK